MSVCDEEGYKYMKIQVLELFLLSHFMQRKDSLLLLDFIQLIGIIDGNAELRKKGRSFF